MQKEGYHSRFATLRPQTSITVRVHDPGHGPGRTHSPRDGGEAQAGHQEGDHEGGQVLGVVGVGALGFMDSG